MRARIKRLGNSLLAWADRTIEKNKCHFKPALKKTLQNLQISCVQRLCIHSSGDTQNDYLRRFIALVQEKNQISRGKNNV